MKISRNRKAPLSLMQMNNLIKNEFVKQQGRRVIGAESVVSLAWSLIFFANRFFTKQLINELMGKLRWSLRYTLPTTRFLFWDFSFIKNLCARKTNTQANGGDAKEIEKDRKSEGEVRPQVTGWWRSKQDVLDIRLELYIVDSLHSWMNLTLHVQTPH